ncbi:MAG: alpha/beta hydrolase [Prolixibacteraceae bacterium]|nr:alpha/beta hydrolase [Prolixibacteraceae bacterium]MBN2775155.1 alpha/beta hydrolase [Prolixibacteraceae bacterium]
MRKYFLSSVILLSFFLLSNKTEAKKNMQEELFTIKIDQPEHGSIKLDPALPDDGKFPKGTVITITATPDSGFAFDGGYYSAPGRWGAMYYESMTPTFKVVVDQDKSVGASFIEKEKLEGFTVIQDVVYAKPGVKTLKYDVYKPDGAKNLPCIVIIHGGGWATNTEDIMRGLARELVRSCEYVVFSIDYRWTAKLDGDETGNTMADLIGDVYGALAHIQEHAKEYGGDPTKIAVTGDSAGGHLSAAAANMTKQIGDEGFGVKKGVFEFMPSYIPEGKSVKQVSKDLTKAIKAAAPSYGVFADLNHYSDSPEADQTWKDAVSPINFIPDVKERAVPQFLTRGTNDLLIRDEMVRTYADALEAAGQKAVYLQVEGAGHAFFDWKPDSRTKATFEKYGVPYASLMKEFFGKVFYTDK